MKIRPAIYEDAAGIARVHVDTWRTTYAGIVPADFLATLSYEQKTKKWQQILGNSSTNWINLVAETDKGEVVGFTCGGQERDGDEEYLGELGGIYLLKAYQRQGIGCCLVAEIVKYLLKTGYPSMLIWSLAQNPSRFFYEALGGQKVRQKNINIGGSDLVEWGYGWKDLYPLLDKTTHI